LLQALQATRSGDFWARMTGDHLGIEGKIANTRNEILPVGGDRHASMSARALQSLRTLDVSGRLSQDWRGPARRVSR